MVIAAVISIAKFLETKKLFFFYLAGIRIAWNIAIRLRWRSVHIFNEPTKCQKEKHPVR